jgi:drug/metabolite transporter (DMT)-like permease
VTTTQPYRRRALAAAAVVLGAVATASNPVFVRLADVDLVASAFHRMFWAIPLFAIWTLLVRRKRPDTRHRKAPFRRDILLLLLCGVFFAGDLVSLHTSISLTFAANAILFLNAQPIYVVVIGWLLFGTLVTRRYVVAATVAMMGAVMLVWQSTPFTGGNLAGGNLAGGNLAGGNLAGRNLAGDGLAVMAGLFYASYIITAARLRSDRTSAEINLWTCVVGAFILLVAALASGQDIVPQTGRDWSLMVALGVVSQATGQGLIVWGLAFLPASFSAVALLVAPVAAAVFAWLVLGETLTPLQLVAMAVVLTGVYGAWWASFSVVDEITEK